MKTKKNTISPALAALVANRFARLKDWRGNHPSKATTTRGQLAALLDYGHALLKAYPNPRPLYGRGHRREGGSNYGRRAEDVATHLRNTRETRIRSRFKQGPNGSRLTTEQQAELLRVRSRPEWTAERIAALRQELKGITVCRARTGRAILAWESTYRFKREEATGIVESLRFLGADTLTTEMEIAPKIRNLCRITAGSEMMHAASHIPFVRANPSRMKDARVYAGREGWGMWEHQLEHEQGGTEWRGSRAMKYHRGVHNIYLPTWIHVLPSLATIRVDDVITEFPAPEGFTWQIDTLGAHLRREDGETYHLSFVDCLRVTSGQAERVVYDMESTFRGREYTRRLVGASKGHVTDQIDGLPLYVCFRDSLRAGNCHQGSLVFARRHKLPTDRHIPARTLIDLGAEEPRALAVVREAYLRSKRELEQGFATLDDHAPVTMN